MNFMEMKILMIEPCYFSTGGYFRAYNNAKSLSERGFLVDLFVSSNKKFEFRIKKSKINENFWLYELPRFDLNPHINFTGRVLRGFIGLLMSFRKKYDVVHVCNPTQFESNIPGAILKLLGKRVVMGWDDFFGGSPIFDNVKFTKKYVHFCETHAPKFFENMVVISDYLGNMAKKLGAKRIVTIINGVSDSARITIHPKNEARKKLNLSNDKKYLFALGNTQSWERTLKLLRIFEEIQRLDSSVMLLCNFDPYKVLEIFKKEHEIEKRFQDKIMNVGYIAENNLEYYLSAADAAILIQGEFENERACYPMRVTSYLGAELPIIMNDVDSEIGRILKQHQCAIMDKDEEILARKIVEYLQDENWQKELREKVRAAKKEMSQEKIILNLIDFYKSIP
jgi:glycosyltransferase involved in cell wall biosynthesis